MGDERIASQKTNVVPFRKRKPKDDADKPGVQILNAGFTCPCGIWHDAGTRCPECDTYVSELRFT